MAEKYIIGYYKLPSDYKATVYVENPRNHEKTKMSVEPEKLNEVLNILKSKYPNHDLCEFKY